MLRSTTRLIVSYPTHHQRSHFFTPLSKANSHSPLYSSSLYIFLSLSLPLLGSISSTFNVQLLRPQIPKVQKDWHLDCIFCTFGIRARKNANKMLVKPTPCLSHSFQPLFLSSPPLTFFLFISPFSIFILYLYYSYTYHTFTLFLCHFFTHTHTHILSLSLFPLSFPSLFLSVDR